MTHVFVSGCFDLFHESHLAFLEFAKRQGDYLSVSIASDETIIQEKRLPVIKEHDRWRIINALKCVDEAFVSDGPPGNYDCFDWVTNNKPNIWVVGVLDSNIKQKKGHAHTLGIRIIEHMRAKGGYSTTGIIENIKECY